MLKVMPLNLIPHSVPLGEKLGAVPFAKSSAQMTRLVVHIYEHGNIDQISQRWRRRISAFN